MVDERLDLTVSERGEWGDPLADPVGTRRPAARCRAFHDPTAEAAVASNALHAQQRQLDPQLYWRPADAVLRLQEVRAAMAAYSPFHNIVSGSYPPLLVTAGLHDRRVDYWQPARCVPVHQCAIVFLACTSLIVRLLRMLRCRRASCRCCRRAVC
jgi:hypothetical protein